MTAVFTYLMITTITYPELRASHALGMGTVQAGAIVAPTAFGRLFPRALLVGAVLYLIGPWFYRRYLVDAPEEGAEESRDPTPGADTE
jgi:archaetidylserine synthase